MSSEAYQKDGTKDEEGEKTLILGLSTVQFIGICIASLALLSTLVAIVMLLVKRCGYCPGATEDGENQFMDSDGEVDSDGERCDGPGPREPTRVRFASTNDQGGEKQLQKPQTQQKKRQQKQKQQQELLQKDVDEQQQPLTAPDTDGDGLEGPVLTPCTQAVAASAVVCVDRAATELIQAQLHYDSEQISKEETSAHAITAGNKSS